MEYVVEAEARFMNQQNTSEITRKGITWCLHLQSAQQPAQFSLAERYYLYYIFTCVMNLKILSRGVGVGNLVI